MRDKIPITLFVYGTLAYDRYLRAITGRIFHKRPCVLEDYEHVAHRHSYAYIRPRKGSRVNGYLIEGLSVRHLTQLDAYEAEGDMYLRKKVRIIISGKEREAYAYVANEKRLERYFPAEPEQRGKQFLEKTLDDIIERETGEGAGKKCTPRELAAREELFGGIIEDMLRSHARYSSLPRDEIKRVLFSRGIPSLRAVREDEAVRPYAGAYILFAVRHIIFNQLEDRMRDQFPGLRPSSPEFYEHGPSDLAALRYANMKQEQIDRLIEEMGCGRFRDEWDHLDYARCGVGIAERIFDRGEAAEVCAWIEENRQPGATPMGAEIEFSYLGARATSARPGQDATYDGFYYFHDFDLLRRGWKLGMYVDNHKAAGLSGERSRGFLEYALGRCKIPDDISKPVTDDPWLLAALIAEAARFCGIRPHSAHLSLQIPLHGPYGKVARSSDLFCLLLLGGDISRDEQGVVREKRLHNREIEDEWGGLYFSKENFHSCGGETQRRVIEYQFPRLALDRDYSPLIMAVKGFHLAGNPHPVNPYMGGADYRPDHPLLMELKRWAESPRPLEDEEIAAFLTRVEEGLNRERDCAPAHRRSFIECSLSAARQTLREVNRRLKE
jgi:gamma-glutamylcyclotransferase (GGCT)/AIG2-like uncharacterized protein YtfP